MCVNEGREATCPILVLAVLKSNFLTLLQLVL